MRPPSPRRPGGSRPRDERPSDAGEAGSAFDEIIAPTHEAEETEQPKRRPVSLVERRRRHGNEPDSIPESLLRLSVGIENVDDLYDDLVNALKEIA